MNHQPERGLAPSGFGRIDRWAGGQSPNQSSTLHYTPGLKLPFRPPRRAKKLKRGMSIDKLLKHKTSGMNRPLSSWWLEEDYYLEQ